MVVRGPNIKPLPELAPLPDTLAAEVVLQVGDNISTDAIMPAGNQVLPLRSNIEAISEHVFEQVRAGFCRGLQGPGHCRGRGRSRITARGRAASMRRWRRGISACAPRS